jgi:hypothetical protein
MWGLCQVTAHGRHRYVVIFFYTISVRCFRWNSKHIWDLIFEQRLDQHDKLHIRIRPRGVASIDRLDNKAAARRGIPQSHDTFSPRVFWAAPGIRHLPSQSQHALHMLKLIEATSAQDEVRPVRSYCVASPQTITNDVQGDRG